MSWYNSRSSSRGSYSGGFAPYVPVAQRRANAAKAAQKAAKSGAQFSPITIEGRQIANTFWGKAWCAHQESFSDYANRLPRGRTYVRNGSVIHLEITTGRIQARVMGSELYSATITVAPLPPTRWKAIKAACAGRIDTLVGLLQGRLSDAVMQIITDRTGGLFPVPSEVKLDCSCPDSADLCKHLSAVLYGVGARLDTQPELLFLLRGVDHLELIGSAVESGALTGGATVELADDQLADVFGIEIDGGATPATTAVAATKPAAGRATAAKPKTTRATPGTSATTAKAAPSKTAITVKTIAAKAAAAKAPPPPAPSPKRTPKPAAPAKGKMAAGKASAVTAKATPPPPKAPVKRLRKQA